MTRKRKPKRMKPYWAFVCGDGTIHGPIMDSRYDWMSRVAREWRTLPCGPHRIVRLVEARR